MFPNFQNYIILGEEKIIEVYFTHKIPKYNTSG